MIELCEALNVYTDGRKTYRRVTSILKDVFPNEYGDINEEVLENAADRGRQTEALCTELLVNGYVDSECRADVIPRLEAFERWRKKYNVEHILHQVTYFDDAQEVAGTVDYELKVEGVSMIVDLKCCASKMRTWPIQVGAYASLAGFSGKVGVLQLNPSANQQGFRWYPYETQKVIAQWNTVYNFWKLNQEL